MDKKYLIKEVLKLIKLKNNTIYNKIIGIEPISEFSNDNSTLSDMGYFTVKHRIGIGEMMESIIVYISKFDKNEVKNQIEELYTHVIMGICSEQLMRDIGIFKKNNVKYN